MEWDTGLFIPLGAGTCTSTSLFYFSSCLKFLIEVYENKPDKSLSQEKHFCFLCLQRFPSQAFKDDHKPSIFAPHWNV